MDKQQKQIIITAVLVIGLIIAWGNAFKVMKKRSKKKAVKKALQSFDVTTKPSGVKRVQLTFVSNEEEGLKCTRCPFSGRIYSERDVEDIDLKLEGILWDDYSPQAIINNKVVSVGSEIGSYTVVEIKQRSVILNDGSNILELRLGQ